MTIVNVSAIPIKIPETEFWGGRGAEVLQGLARLQIELGNPPLRVLG